MIKKLLCAIFGHLYFIEIEFGTSRKIGCKRCNKKFGMHDSTRSFVPWDSEIEDMYRSIGKLP